MFVTVYVILPILCTNTPNSVFMFVRHNLLSFHGLNHWLRAGSWNRMLLIFYNNAYRSLIYMSLNVFTGGRDSAVGISTRRVSKPAERVVKDFVFSVPVQTGRGIHPASSTMDTGDLYQGQSGWGVALTSDRHVTTRLRVSRAVPLFPPVSPLAFYGATFTFTCYCGQHRVNANVTSMPQVQLEARSQATNKT
jgi:hypothetical protein